MWRLKNIKCEIGQVLIRGDGLNVYSGNTEGSSERAAIALLFGPCSRFHLIFWYHRPAEGVGVKRDVRSASLVRNYVRLEYDDPLKS